MSDYQVVCADLERDRDAIVSVWGRNLSSESPDRHAQKYAWYLQQNPCGAGRCWLLLHGTDSQVVGTAGLGLRWLRVGGARVRVGLASDFAVDKEHRHLQPAMLLQRAVLACLGEDLPVIYGLPNSKSAPLFQRLGYQKVGGLQRHVKVLRVERFLKARQGVWKGLYWLSPLINLALRAKSADCWRRLRGREVRVLPRFDERFDALWGRASATAPVMGERSGDVLRWRYGACPLRQYVILGLLTPADERLLGYGVCHVKDNEQVEVVDFLVEEAEGAAEDLLAGLISWSRSQGAASMAFECFAAPRLEQSLQKMGFAPRKHQPPRPVMVHTSSFAEVPVERLQNWYFLLGDEDYN